MEILTLEDATKMTSKEVADLLETRHDSVKRTVERLTVNEVIPQTPLVDGIKSANGVVERVYFLDKRSSLIVVAQISPQFTARLVDRWQELEAQQVPKIPKTYAAALLEAGRLAEIVENQSLVIENQAHRLDEAKKWASVKRMETSYGLTFKFSELKKYSLKHGYDMPKVRDANYAAGVNTYHEDVWMAVYQVDIPE